MRNREPTMAIASSRKMIVTSFGLVSLNGFLKKSKDNIVFASRN